MSSGHPDHAEHCADHECDKRAMSGMRDRLIHDYFGVDYELVWGRRSQPNPELRRQIASMLETHTPVEPTSHEE